MLDAASSSAEADAVRALLADGFVLLRGVVPAAECRRFLADAVVPALVSAGISAHDCTTWPDHGGGGTTVKGRDGHPIARGTDDSRWPAFFESTALLGFLDALHGGRSEWRWVDGAASGVGWLHLRYPVCRESRWAPPGADGGWHIDGDGSKRSLATDQSVVLLPLVTPIRPGGGGTALIPRSHVEVARWLCEVDDEAVAASRLPGCLCGIASRALGRGGVVEATGDAGDVLVLHPFMVHAASRAHERTEVDGAPFGHGIRVTFNLSTNWALPHAERRGVKRARPADGREIGRPPGLAAGDAGGGSSPLADWLLQVAAGGSGPT